MEVLIGAVTSWVIAKLFDEGIKIAQKYIKKEDKSKNEKNDKDQTK